jgi:hypothetical protein
MATLRVTELDFDAIKQNIKSYLTGQSQFSDYDFEGSGLSVLIDTLAYNTHYNAFYLNMAMNEIFVDSAVKRESVVSLSKMLNYVPRSARAAVAKINVTVNGVVGAPASLVIDRYTAFTSSIGGVAYTFYNLEPATITPTGSTYVYNSLDIKEGTFVVNKFTVGATPGPAEKFVIPNAGLDTSTLRVTVQDTASSSASETYTKFDGDITGVVSTTKIYYLEQNSQGLYEIYFGDGVLGAKLTTNNQVTVEYLVTNGTEANVSDKITQTFELAGTIEGYTDVTIVIVERSNNGQDEETIDEIRFNAPRYATTQNRLVTKKDYEAFLKANYNYIDACVVWGGEDNDPPQFGKVMISILPKQNQYLTTSRKNTITNELKSKRALSLVPEYVDPDVFFINLTSTIKYNPNITNDSATDIENAARTAVQNYFAQNVTTFGDLFSASKLTAAIDASKASILGNSTIPIIQKRLEVTLGQPTSQNFKILNKIEQNSISSTRFYFAFLNQILPARIKDEALATQVEYEGSYRRTKDVVTVTTEVPHDLLVGEKINIQFSGTALSGEYVVDQVQSDTIFTVITLASGITYGSATITTQTRGVLKIIDPTNNAILNNNIGFVNYTSGVVQINNLNVFGFLQDQSDVRMYFRLTRDSEDIFVERNQILRLDDSTSNELTNRLGGLTISTQAIAK